MPIRFVKPTTALVHRIADNMRGEDAAEVWAASHHTPLESLLASWAASEFCTVALSAEGEPLVMFGLVRRDLVSDRGVIWMLGADTSRAHKKEFLLQTPKVISQMLLVCRRLHNMVHSKNRASLRWLRWLGFTILPPRPHGPDGELFHEFYIERGADV